MGRAPMSGRHRGAAFVALATVSCGDADPRDQLVVYIDTDLSVPEHVDTVLVERLDPDGASVESRQDVAPNPSDWPISFAVLPGATVRFRVRAYPEGRLVTLTYSETNPVGPESACPTADAGDYRFGDAEIGEPLAGTAVDRLV